MLYFRKLLSNVFFLKYFTINYVLNFLYKIFNEKSFNEKFLLTINCTRKEGGDSAVREAYERHNCFFAGSLKNRNKIQ